MKPLFILTSALNTKFGVHSNEQRLVQTLDSIASIRKYCPNAKIALVEMAGMPPTQEQIDVLTAKVDYYRNHSKDPDVIGIFNSTENWDIVKNTTEVMVFANVLSELVEEGVLDRFTRIFKMSGRYQLNDAFNPAYYATVPDSIVVLQRKVSQFPPEVTDGMKFQYMSRLWSWPAIETDYVIQAYSEGFLAMAKRLSEGGYFDIEHMLFKYLPNELIREIPEVGIQGLLGPNGIAIQD